MLSMDATHPRQVFVWDHGTWAPQKLGPLPLDESVTGDRCSRTNFAFAGERLAALADATPGWLCLVHANDHEWEQITRLLQDLPCKGEGTLIRISAIPFSHPQQRSLISKSGHLIAALELTDASSLARQPDSFAQLLRLCHADALQVMNSADHSELPEFLRKWFGVSRFPETAACLHLLVGFTRFVQQHSSPNASSVSRSQIHALWQNALPLDWEARLSKEALPPAGILPAAGTVKRLLRDGLGAGWR